MSEITFWSAEESYRRQLIGDGFEDGYEGRPPRSRNEAYLSGWNRGRFDYTPLPKSERKNATIPNDSDADRERPGQQHDGGGMQGRDLDRREVDAESPGLPEGPAVCSGQIPDHVPVRETAAEVDRVRKEAPLNEACGIVVIVDFLNVLVRSFHASPPSLINGVRGMLDTVKSTIERLSPEFLIFAADGGYAARTQLYPAYKQNRGPKPEGLAEQIEMAEAAIDAIGWPMIRFVDWEADDVIASLSRQLVDVAAAVIIVSSDKDLLQLVDGPDAPKVYHPWNGGKILKAADCQEKFGVPPKQLGDYLALVGDSSDGVPGVKGIGPKKAAELLTARGSLDQVLEAARCLQIPGAAGKNLREQTDVARLSRRLVELQADLPVDDRWRQFPAKSPRDGWQDELKKLGLVASAQRLAEILPAGSPRVESSILEMEWCRIESFSAVMPEKPQIIHETPVLEAKTGGFITKTPVSIHYDAAAKVYNEAVAARAKHGQPAASGYFEGTLLRLAWDAGSNGVPFDSIDLAAFDEFGKPLKPVSLPVQPAPAAEAKLQTRSLF